MQSCLICRVHFIFASPLIRDNLCRYFLISVFLQRDENRLYGIFDGIILQLIVIVSVIPVIELVDEYDEIFIIVIIYLLVIATTTDQFYYHKCLDQQEYCKTCL